MGVINDAVMCDGCYRKMLDNKTFYWAKNDIDVFCEDCLMEEMKKEGRLEEIESGFIFNDTFFSFDDEEDMRNIIIEHFEAVDWDDLNKEDENDSEIKFYGRYEEL